MLTAVSKGQGEKVVAGCSFGGHVSDPEIERAIFYALFALRRVLGVGKNPGETNNRPSGHVSNTQTLHRREGCRLLHLIRPLLRIMQS